MILIVVHVRTIVILIFQIFSHLLAPQNLANQLPISKSSEQNNLQKVICCNLSLPYNRLRKLDENKCNLRFKLTIVSFVRKGGLLI
jgi:hypothetical protein